VVIAFGWKELLGRKGHRVPYALGILLFQHRATSKVAGITGETIGLAQFRMFEDRGSDNSITKEFKSCMSLICPNSRGIFACEGCERQSDFGVIPDEAAEVIGKTQEGSDIFFGRGCRPLLHNSNFIRINANTFSIHNMTKEFDRSLEEITLLELDVVVVCFQKAEDFVDMFHMVIKGLGVDEDIIHVDQNKLANSVSKELIHSTLESGRGVAQPKRHDKPFIVTNGSGKSCLGNISRLDLDLMIAGGKIQGSEVLRTIKHVQEVINTGKGISILDSDLVQGTIIHTHPQSTILFTNKENGGTIGRSAGTDVMKIKEGFDGSVDLFSFFGTVSPTRTSERGLFTWVQGDTMFHIMRFMGENTRRRSLSHFGMGLQHSDSFWREAVKRRAIRLGLVNHSEIHRGFKEIFGFLQEASHCHGRQQLDIRVALLQDTLFMKNLGVIAHDSIPTSGTMESAEAVSKGQDNLVLFHPYITNDEIKTIR
jgi:hypothetical protein